MTRLRKVYIIKDYNVYIIILKLYGVVMVKNKLWRWVGTGLLLLWYGKAVLAHEINADFSHSSTNSPIKVIVAIPSGGGQIHNLTALSWQRTAATGVALFAAVFGVSEYINPTIIPVAIGGALGSVTRYMLSKGVGGWMEQDYPYGTLTVNIAGSFVFGAISGWAGLREETPDGAWVALVTTGFLGGFTTFSTFAHDTVGLAHDEGIVSATFYTTSSVGIAILAMLAGEVVGSYFTMY